MWCISQTGNTKWKEESTVDVPQFLQQVAIAAILFSIGSEGVHNLFAILIPRMTGGADVVSAVGGHRLNPVRHRIWRSSQSIRNPYRKDDCWCRCGIDFSYISNIRLQRLPVMHYESEACVVVHNGDVGDLARVVVAAYGDGVHKWYLFILLS